LQKLLADVMDPLRIFQAVLVSDVSRWGRFQDVDESAHYEYVCRKAGVQVIYCDESFDNDGSPAANLLKTLKRAMAGEYSREHSRKVFAGQRRLAEYGFWQGSSAGFGLQRILVDSSRQTKGPLRDHERKSLQTDRVAGALSLDDYVLALERFIRTAGANGSPVHVVAVCQATVPALAAAALLARARTVPFASLSLLGGPIDSRINPTSIDRFVTSHTLAWFRDQVIDVVPPPYRGAGRRVYPGFIQQAAIWAAHPERHLRLESAYWSNWLAGDMRAAAQALRSLNEYAAVLDMAESYFLDILRIVFQEHWLPRNAWSVQGRHVELSALSRAPLCQFFPRRNLSEEALHWVKCE